ncbi:MAG: threonylcarbamoyl-AMP synthase [Holosporaceae bacterium]|nr:threonylcarbamoyl-AMP synthase [Holosporaceae bacterium]
MFELVPNHPNDIGYALCKNHHQASNGKLKMGFCLMPKILEPCPENITKAIYMLESGGIVAFPTETVYGIGANACSAAAVDKIFFHKHRSKSNPLSVCYKNLAQAARDVVVTDHAIALAEAFLPGPITLLLERRSDASIAALCSANTNKIGIRISSNGILQNLLTQISFPLASSSANKSSALSPTTTALVLEQLQSMEDLIILDGGNCEIGIESTVLDASGDLLKIVRSGAIDANEIHARSGIFCKNKEISCNAATSSPDHGNFYSNDGNPSDQLGKIGKAAELQHYTFHKKIILNATCADPGDAVLAFGIPFDCQCQYILNLSESCNLREAASHLFAMLQKLDNSNAKKICVMPIPHEDIGIAINDRLAKAARSWNETDR